jgi:insulysin
MVGQSSMAVFTGAGLALAGVAGGIALRLEKPEVTKVTDKPQGDTRSYQHSVLSNGLRVLNVQDDRALESAFAMAVQSGSSNDPLEFPGLAHFCEHMVFLGTEKYPDPSGFDNFMGANGGSNNAYTSFDLTVYFGQISHKAGFEAMDRFADFFKKPKFNRSFVEKEVHAIDSEHAKNVQSHSNRIVQTMYSLASSDNPVSRFHTGNLDTLYTEPMSKGKNPVDALELYFKRYYCPDKMRLVTFGPEKLAEQLSTSEKLFGSIPVGSEECRAKPVNRYDSPAPFAKPNLGNFVHIQGTQPSAALWLHFPMQELTGHWDSHPTQYINYLLGYSGTDSLSHVLTDQLGLATDSGAMFDKNLAGSQLFFVVTLTEKGRKDPSAVIDVLFSYLAEVRRRGVDEALYRSIANISALEWDWDEMSGPMDTASGLAGLMTRPVPVDKILSATGRIDKIDTKLVASLLDKINPDNMNAALVYPPLEEEELSKAGPVQRGLQQGAFKQLPFYNVSYNVQPISEVLGGSVGRWQDLLRGSQEPKVALAGSKLPRIPSAIKDVPTKIPLDNMHAVLPGSDGGFDEKLYGQKPQQLEGDLWYRSGWVTSSPKVTTQLSFMPLRTPLEEPSAVDSMRLELYSRLLKEEMGPKLVDLKATGVSGGIAVSRDGVSLSFDGFAPLLPRLADEVLKEFNAFNANSSITDPKRYERVVQDLREGLTTYDDMPVKYANSDLSLLLTKGGHSHKEALKALDQMTLESVARAAEELMLSRKLQLTSLAMGNLPQAKAVELVQQAAAGVQSKERRAKMTSSSDAKVELIAAVVNPGQPIELRTKNPRDGDPNDVAVVALLDDVKTVKSRVLLGLVGKILGTVAYNELRTVRQLGYVVQGGATSFSNVMAVKVMVQGIVLDADQAEAAIQAVITDFMPRRLAELKQEELDSMKSALLNELVTPPVGASEEAGHFWGPVRQGGRCFELQDEMFAFLNTTGAVTKKALQETWAALAMPSEGIRKKVVAKYFAKKVPPLPQASEAAAMWAKQGVPEAHQALLRAELAKTLVVDRADSQTREQVLKTGGYFPTDLKCSRAEK